MLSPSLPLDPADEPLFAPAAKTLADTLPAKFRGLDANRDGFITRAELAPLETELWLKWSEGAAPDVAGDANAFERYGDTPLPAGQAMHYLGLEAAITPNGCVAAGVWQVFDSNADGAVDRREWGAALGDLGADGNAAKRLVFDRVDRVSGSGGALAPEQFQTALGQIRGVVAGGGGAEGVVFGLGK
ncbi:MAG: hypothetical protein J3K34DRAFT_418263 [Monoraphidium minutum]|nr:MAG: hypothetical protein J3K34DRAFT_418263 [Monoraphidium minutum]